MIKTEEYKIPESFIKEHDLTKKNEFYYGSFKSEELTLWNENPRSETNINDDENAIMMDLLEETTKVKTINLMRDIIENKVYIDPIGVYIDGKVVIHDGNRRVSAIKALLNPERIPLISQDIINLTSKYPNWNELKNNIQNIVIKFMTKNDALKAIERIHNVDSVGIGPIPWNSYQKDKNRLTYGKSPEYPFGYCFFKFMGARKTDVKKDKIGYTTYDRIFTPDIQDLLNVHYEFADNKEEPSFLSDSTPQTARDIICEYLNEINKPSTRAFNDKKDIERFIAWFKNKYDESSKIQFRIKEHLEIPYGTPLDKNLLKIDCYDGEERIEDYYLCYINPNGQLVKDINTKIAGEWKVKVSYKTKEIHARITVLEKIVGISINRTCIELQLNTSYDLYQNILSYYDNNGLSKSKDTIQFTCESTMLENGVFPANLSEGEYIINYQSEEKFGGSFIVKVLRTEKYKPKVPLNNTLFVFDDNKVCINISPVLNSLIVELNKLDCEEFTHVVASSFRSLIEIIYEVFMNKGIVEGKKKTSNKLDQILDCLLQEDCLSKTCNAKKLSYQSMFSMLSTLKHESDNIWKKLNLAAHTNLSYITSRDLIEIGQKHLSKVIELCSYRLIYQC